MRKSMIAVLAAVALGTSAVTAAIAAPHGGGGGGHMSGGGGGHMSGFGGGGHMGGGFGGVGHIGGLGSVGHIGNGGIARGGIGSPVDHFSPLRSSAPHIVTAPTYAAHGQAFARRGDHDHDHDRDHHRCFFFRP